MGFEDFQNAMQLFCLRRMNRLLFPDLFGEPVECGLKIVQKIPVSQLHRLEFSGMQVLLHGPAESLEGPNKAMRKTDHVPQHCGTDNQHRKNQRSAVAEKIIHESFQTESTMPVQHPWKLPKQLFARHYRQQDEVVQQGVNQESSQQPALEFRFDKPT